MWLVFKELLGTQKRGRSVEPFDLQLLDLV